MMQKRAGPSRTVEIGFREDQQERLDYGQRVVKAVWWIEKYQETRFCRDPRRSPVMLLQLSDATANTKINELYA